MLVQDKAYLLLLMCLSMPCPAEMAVLEQVAGSPEQAMAYLNIRLKIRAILYGLASRIAQVVGRGLKSTVKTALQAVVAALMAATATRDKIIACQLPMAAQAAVLQVEMQHIMVRVPAVADIIILAVMIFSTTAAAVIKALFIFVYPKIRRHKEEKMKYAVVKSDMVENVLVASPEQKDELEASLNAELVDASQFGLQIGDMRVNGAWTRNQDGEQITLDENATYDELVAHIAELEAILKGKEANTNAAEE